MIIPIVYLMMKHCHQLRRNLLHGNTLLFGNTLFLLRDSQNNWISEKSKLISWWSVDESNSWICWFTYNNIQIRQKLLGILLTTKMFFVEVFKVEIKLVYINLYPNVTFCNLYHQIIFYEKVKFCWIPKSVNRTWYQVNQAMPSVDTRIYKLITNVIKIEYWKDRADYYQVSFFSFIF